MLSVERAIAQHGAQKWEKDTKTHRSRRLALDSETVALLTSHKALCSSRADAVDVELPPDAFVFSPAPDGSQHLNPESVGQRYSRRARRLGIATTIHKLRHYATELIAAGVDVRTVAGRLGHGGGGTTTLRVYAAWVSEADQRAATGLLSHLPQRPSAGLGAVVEDTVPRNPYELIAADIRAQIVCGALAHGTPIPSRKELATTYNVAVGTAHRAIVLLASWGLVENRRGHRAIVRDVIAADDLSADTPPAGVAATSSTAVPLSTLAELTIRHRGTQVAQVTADVPVLSTEVLTRLLRAAARRAAGADADLGDYEMDVRYLAAPEKSLTFVASV